MYTYVYNLFVGIFQHKYGLEHIHIERFSITPLLIFWVVMKQSPLDWEKILQALSLGLSKVYTNDKFPLRVINWALNGNSFHIWLYIKCSPFVCGISQSVFFSWAMVVVNH